MIGRREVTLPREDVSRFVVHLTRDDTGEWDGAGQEARLNFLDIYRQRKILALKAHCLHAKKMTPKQRKKCRVACFTEMPLTAIQHVARPIPGRQIQLEPYGFVFKREFIIEKGAQQVQYVNSYAGNSEVRDGYDSIFTIAAKKDFTGRMWRTLPFVSAMHESCDFCWEREWRILGDLTFNYSDLVCLILPEEGNGPLKFSLAQKGISWIAPEWGAEQIVECLSDQQRRTRRLNPPTEKPQLVVRRTADY